MAKVEQLKCPSCGATEVSHISGINYQCDYCHSTFLVKNENPFHQVHPQKPINVTPVSIKPVKIIVVFAVLMAVVGVGVSVFVLSVSKSAISSSTSFLSDWQKPGVDNYNCLAGSKGAVVWLVVKTQTNKLDSVKYWLRLIDPVTKKIISEEPLGKPKAWKELFNQSKIFDSEYYVSNDTVYNVSEDGGIQGFSLYTGKRLFGNEWFEKRFPQLKEGLIKTDKEYYRNRIKISSAAGDDLYYYLDSKLLLTEKEAEKVNSEERVFEENIYLSQNKKAQLYLCNMKRNSGDSYNISDSYLEQFKSSNNYMSSYIKSIKPLSDSIYAMATPVKKYDDKLLFFYASNFSKHADGVLALVDKNGQFTWRNKDSTFKKIVSNNSSDNIYLRYNLGKDLIVININGSVNQSVGVNLKTGKTQFIFNQSYSLD